MRRRVGVVGLGVISQYYLAAIDASAQWELVAVCDVRDAALASYRDRVPCYRRHEELLAAGTVDAVIVTAPNDAHAAVCAAALKAGVPVCVEKPLAVSLSQGEQLHRLARAQGVTLFTAFHRRYNANVRALRREVDRASIASVEVRYLELIEDHMGEDTWYLSPQRCGGGCIADNGPNAFDVIRMFLGETAVSDVAVRRDASGVDRQARITLHNGCGVPATVALDWSYQGEVKDITVHLADGSVRAADMLAGYPGFKSSLWHEYHGVLRDFAAVVADGVPDDAGLAALALVAEGYAKETPVTPQEPAPELR